MDSPNHLEWTDNPAVEQPTPWRLEYMPGGWVGIVDAKGYDVAKARHSAPYSNAGPLIVRAVNAHDKLVEALVRAKRDIAALHDMYCRDEGDGECSHPFDGLDGAAIGRINAALADATGGDDA